MWALGLLLCLFLVEKKSAKEKVPQWQLDSRKAMENSLARLTETEKVLLLEKEKE